MCTLLSLFYEALTASCSYVLSGGFHDYVHRYKSNGALVENFDQQAWTAEGVHVNDTNLVRHLVSRRCSR